jgi:hypothetical protein
METKTTFQEPVVKLMEIGRPGPGPWLDYREYGITSENIPELIRLAGDIDLSLDEDKDEKTWGPVHAWRALGQLRAEEAMDVLVDLIEKMSEDDWIVDDLPSVFARIGPSALSALAGYLANPERNYHTRATASKSIARIGAEYPEMREQCVQIISAQLEKYRENNPTLNAFLIVDLITLCAKETLPLIRMAYDDGGIDEGIIRWADVRREKQKWYKKYQIRHKK